MQTLHSICKVIRPVHTCVCVCGFVSCVPLDFEEPKVWAWRGMRLIPFFLGGVETRGCSIRGPSAKRPAESAFRKRYVSDGIQLGQGCASCLAFASVCHLPVSSIYYALKIPPFCFLTRPPPPTYSFCKVENQITSQYCYLGYFGKCYCTCSTAAFLGGEGKSRCFSGSTVFDKHNDIIMLQFYCFCKHHNK